jgi:prepilin-type N-terminal cleavage/methylation domain-containing protein
MEAGQTKGLSQNPEIRPAGSRSHTTSGIGSKHLIRRAGYTLLEVLVVVAIISLLLAILASSLSTARYSASRLRCAANLRAVGNALTLYRHATNQYPKPDGPPRYGNLDCIGEVAEQLVRGSLGEPRALYCPDSLASDKHATGPFVRTYLGTQIMEYWRTGQISYAYLAGVTDPFLLDNMATYDVQRESPDHPKNTRAVLIGDRTVVFRPGTKNIPGSNHGDRGGWFYFVSGDVLWRDWSTLAVHPASGSRYDWYWPRTASRLPPG